MYAGNLGVIVEDFEDASSVARVDGHVAVKTQEQTAVLDRGARLDHHRARNDILNKIFGVIKDHV